MRQTKQALLEENARLRDELARWSRPCVVIEPCCLGGQPRIHGHRLSVEQFADLWWYDKAEWTLALIYSNWDVTLADLLCAWWYIARYGSRTWRKRWGAWADAAFEHLWHQDWAAAPLPPRQSEVS